MLPFLMKLLIGYEFPRIEVEERFCRKVFEIW